MKLNPNCKTQRAIAWVQEKPSRTVSMAALKFDVYRSGIHTALQRSEIDRLKMRIVELEAMMPKCAKELYQID